MSIYQASLVTVEVDTTGLEDRLSELQAPMDEDDVRRIVSDVLADESYMTYSSVEDVVSEYVHDNVYLDGKADADDLSELVERVNDLEGAFDVEAYNARTEDMDRRVEKLEADLAEASTYITSLTEDVEYLRTRDDRTGNILALLKRLFNEVMR